MSIWEGIKAALREFAHPTWEHEDETDLEAEAAERTRWVRDHRHPPEGG